MKYCPKCGAEFDAEDHFCMLCGAELIEKDSQQESSDPVNTEKPDGESAEAQSADLVTSEPSAAEKKSFNKKPLIISLVVLAVIVLTAGGFFLYRYLFPSLTTSAESMSIQRGEKAELSIQYGGKEKLIFSKQGESFKYDINESEGEGNYLITVYGMKKGSGKLIVSPEGKEKPMLEIPVEVIHDDVYVNVPPQEEQLLSVEPMPQEEAENEPAHIESFSDATGGDTNARFSFTPTNPGRYCLVVTGTDSKLWPKLFDPDGNLAGSGFFLGFSYAPGSSWDFTPEETMLNRKWSIELYGSSSFGLDIYYPGLPMDISSLSIIKDKIACEDQVLYYSLSPKVSGLYSFGIEEMKEGNKIKLSVHDEQGKSCLDSNLKNGEYCSVELDAGKAYSVSITQHTGLGSFRLLLRSQKPVQDVSNVSLVSDSIEIPRQKNIYSICPEHNGRLRLDFQEMAEDVSLKLGIYDNLGECICDEQVLNGEGITLMGLKAGETYTVNIVQNEGLGSYEMHLGHQKAENEIPDDCYVRDAIEYIDQRNLYVFTPLAGGGYVIELDALPAGTELQLLLTNALGETLTELYSSGGETLKLGPLEAGEQYYLQINQQEGMAKYELNLHPEYDFS